MTEATMKGSQMRRNETPYKMFEAILGSWSLQSFHVMRNGSIENKPFGEDPIGTMIYQRDGNFSAQVMKANRKKFDSVTQFDGTFEESENAFSGYIAYFGNFKVNEQNQTIAHLVTGSLFPNWVGSTLSRNLRISAGCLILDTRTQKDEALHSAYGKFVWVRSEELGEQNNDA